MDLKLFIPITKIDVAKRLVYGTIAEEVPDHADEIMDYATARPKFEAWSAQIEKASNGRSVGNLRAMHGSVAAGKLDQIIFDDDARRIATVAKVVDDSEWQKVLEGVYTGFSMGGRYARRWPDPDRPALTRYTPEPMEVSLVDHPCIPSATFEVVKADGSVELRKFKRSEAERDVSRDAAEFADPGYRADRRKRFPLDTQAHIRGAWAHIHHTANQMPYTADQLAQIKARIVAAWKAKIDKDGPPLAAAKGAAGASLVKNLGDVSQLALVIDDLAQISAALDDAGADQTPALKASLRNLVGLLQSLLAQATAGLGDDTAAPGGDADADATASDDAADDTAQDDANDEDVDADADDADADDDRAAFKSRAIVLAKALGKIAPRMAALTARIDGLAKRVAELEAQPLPGGPVTKFVTVTKQQDAGHRDGAAADPLEGFQRHLERLAPAERAHLLTKLALRNPVAR